MIASKLNFEKKNNKHQTSQTKWNVRKWKKYIPPPPPKLMQFLISGKISIFLAWVISARKNDKLFLERFKKNVKINQSIFLLVYVIFLLLISINFIDYYINLTLIREKGIVPSYRRRRMYKYGWKSLSPNHHWKLIWIKFFASDSVFFSLWKLNFSRNFFHLFLFEMITNEQQQQRWWPENFHW